MSASQPLPPPRGPLCRIFRPFLAALCFLGVIVSPASAAETPWLIHPWKYNFDIPAGKYAGPDHSITVARTVQIGWLPGSQITNLTLQMDSAAGMQASGCQFRLFDLGLSLKGRLELKDSLLDECLLKKINVWGDKKDPATRWRLSNCLIAKSFMGDSIETADAGVNAVDCTFLDAKMPSIQYRGGDVVNQAQQDWMKFEKCRFVNCVVNDRFLAATVNCVFDNCRYIGPDTKFAEQVRASFEAKAYWTGTPAPDPVNIGHFLLSFPPPDNSIKAGTLMEYKNKDGQVSLTAFTPVVAETAVLGAGIRPTIFSENTTPAAPTRPSTPVPPAPVSKPAAPEEPGNAIASSDPSAATGSIGAPAIPLKKTRSVVNALLVIELPGQGVAGAAAKLSAMALPIDPQASTEVAFNVPVGPMMQTALKEVVKCLQLRHKGWPRGHRIELAFEDKFVPKDGPSAAVACALLLDSMIAGWEIDASTAFTGDLNADGSVQPIGGVSGKIRGATKAGCQRVAVPLKNVGSVSDVLITDGPEPLARIEVFSIDTLDSALALARRGATIPAASSAGPLKTPSAAAAKPAPASPDAAQLFQNVRRSLLPANRWSPAALRDVKVAASLREILRQQPNDISARLLLAAAQGSAPGRLTLRGSIDALDQIGVNLIQAIKSKEASDMAKIGRDQLGDAVFKLKRIRTQMDTRVVPALDSLTRFGENVRIIQNQPPRTQAKASELYTNLMASAKEADRQRDLLMKNREVVEELMK